VSLQSIGGKKLANNDTNRFLQQIIIIIDAHALVFVFSQATAYVHVLGKSLMSTWGMAVSRFTVEAVIRGYLVYKVKYMAESNNGRRAFMRAGD